MTRTEYAERDKELGTLRLIADAHRMREQGRSTAETARELQVSRRTVFRYLSCPEPVSCPCCDRLHLPLD